MSNRKEIPMTHKQLDPRTAYVGIHPEYDLSGCLESVMEYWYDPVGRLPSIGDRAFAHQHPEITDEEWDRLFIEAFHRGEAAFRRRKDFISGWMEDQTAPPCHGGSKEA
jgi:hypothetical protein